MTRRKLPNLGILESKRRPCVHAPPAAGRPPSGSPPRGRAAANAGRTTCRRPTKAGCTTGRPEASRSSRTSLWTVASARPERAASRAATVLRSTAPIDTWPTLRRPSTPTVRRVCETRVDRDSLTEELLSALPRPRAPRRARPATPAAWCRTCRGSTPARRPRTPRTAGTRARPTSGDVPRPTPRRPPARAGAAPASPPAQAPARSARAKCRGGSRGDRRGRQRAGRHDVSSRWATRDMLPVTT